MISSPAKTVTVISGDGDEFEIPINVAEQSKLIKNMIDDVDVSNKVPLSNVNSATLAQVIEYCRKHAEHGAMADKELKKWDDDFFKGKTHGMLFGIILSAKYLDIRSLYDLCCQAVADMLMTQDKSVEEVREIFNIKNNYSPEEEQIRREDE